MWKNRGITHQIRHAQGFIQGYLYVDAKRTFWTVTLWQDKASMLAFRSNGNHGAAMAKLAIWADEGRAGNWEQLEEALPDIEVVAEGLLKNGHHSKLKFPSKEHLEKVPFPMPRKADWRRDLIKPA